LIDSLGVIIVRNNRDQLTAAVEVKEESEDPSVAARRRELRDQIARLNAQIDALQQSLTPRSTTLEAKEIEYAPMATEVKRLFDVAKPLDEERARLLATYRLLQDADGKQVAFGPTEVKALERLNHLNEQIPGIRAVIEPIFRDLKEKDKNEKERERIKGSFAALKEEIKQKKEAGDEEGAAAIKEKALAEKKEYESLGAWLAAYPAKREEFDTKKAEMTTLEGERQAMCATVFRFAWMKQNGEEKIVLRPPSIDELKRLGEIYGHRARFTEAKAAMDPLKKQLDVLRNEVANEKTTLSGYHDELKRLQAEFDALPAPPAAATKKASAPVTAAKSTNSSRSGVAGGVDPAVVARMEREAAADKKAAIDKQRVSYDEQIAELNERIRKLQKVIDDMRDADTDSRLRILDQQLKDERSSYEQKIATLQASSSVSDKHIDETKKLTAEIARLTESLRKAEDNLKVNIINFPSLVMATTYLCV
jgi:chromosome segregation ATPase